MYSAVLSVVLALITTNLSHVFMSAHTSCLHDYICMSLVYPATVARDGRNEQIHERITEEMVKEKHGKRDPHTSSS